MTWDEPPRTVVRKGKAGREVVAHVHKDGARYHVLWWDQRGTHCSEPDCEINHPEPARRRTAA